MDDIQAIDEVADELVDIEEIDATFDNALDFDAIVDPNNWQPPGEYYQTMPQNTRKVVGTVVESDEQLRQELREEYFPQLLRTGGIKLWENANSEYLELVQHKLLYPGKVVAADGTIAKYETLSLVGAQIAISKVSYQGSTGQLVHNIMHWGRELPRQTTASDIVAAIQTRGKKLKNKLPNLFLYALMTYKERQVLLDSPADTFKLIQGTMFPHEMLSGSGRQHILKPCLDLLKQLIDDGSYAAIVSNDSHRDWLALGMALNPGEYIVMNSGDEILDEFGDRANYTSTPIPQYGGKNQIELFNEFKTGYASKVVQGVLRSHPMSPPYVFYCNADRIHDAVHMLLADAANSGARGFPLLVDMADQYCSGAFKSSEYTNHMNAEFVRAGKGSGMYQAERTTRD